MEGEEAEMGRGGGDMQFVRDMNELMEIATDAVKKRKVRIIYSFQPRMGDGIC